MPLQTFPVAAAGGLDLVSSLQVLAQKPGAAVVLENYEVLNEGGYQKVKGLTEWGELPDAYRQLPIRGFVAFKGVVVVAGEYVLHSPDGASWFVVNREKVLDTPSSELAASKGGSNSTAGLQSCILLGSHGGGFSDALYN